jgi:hypothetical protein
MVESARRHGYFDPRYPPRVAVERIPKLSLVSNGLGSIDGTDVVAVPAPPRLVLAGGRDDARVPDWENEGGYIAEPKLTDLGSEHLPVGLGWYEFLAIRFPDARRHDLEALKAYEAYRSSGEAGPPE